MYRMNIKGCVLRSYSNICKSVINYSIHICQELQILYVPILHDNHNGTAGSMKWDFEMIILIKPLVRTRT